MFVELVELLRCPNSHEPSRLVASAHRTEERQIMEGVLGCPVCSAEFTIADGVARFEDPPWLAPAEQPSAEIAMRLAAFLELTDAGGFALLCGRWGSHADQIRRLSGAPLVLVNPPAGAERQDVAASILVGTRMPLAAGSVRGAALDAPEPFAESIVPCVRERGRLVGQISLAVPAGVTELVRDERMWVAERNAVDPVKPLVSLRRAGS